MGALTDAERRERGRERARRWREENPEKARKYNHDRDVCNPARNKKRYQSLKKRRPKALKLHWCRTRARAKGVPFGLTEDNLPWPIPKACDCCKAPFIQSIKAARATLDRVVPALGYVPENVVWICQSCNDSKGDLVLDNLKPGLRPDSLIEYIRRHTQPAQAVSVS